MTNLSRLKVSLTKHNAHKVARIVKEYGPDSVFGHLHEVHADAAQARKNLSASPTGQLPALWGRARDIGSSAVDALMLVAIIFSHRDLIRAVVEAKDRIGFRGRIERDDKLTGKAYTNFVRVVDQLGYADRVEYTGVTFDWKQMFGVPGLGPLVGELLAHKLSSVGWDKSNTISEEILRLNLNEVFGLSAAETEAWLSYGSKPMLAESGLAPKDEAFFQNDAEGPTAQEFAFKPGHVERDEEPLGISASPRAEMRRLHNQIQNRLYKHLAAQFGEANVGTENGTGSGTSIDLVVQGREGLAFFEIKTASSVRSSIRQAVPQLMEYAFWPEAYRAQRLIIVSHLPITADAQAYIEHLKSTFGLPLEYRQFDLTTNALL